MSRLATFLGPLSSVESALVWIFLLFGLMLVASRVAIVPLTAEPVPFDVYVINLRTAPQRMSSFMSRLRATDMREAAPIRFDAVDGRQLHLESHVTPTAMAEVVQAERSGYRQRHYELTRGAVGCYLSHMGVWKRMVESDKDMVLVCEDDAVLDSRAGRKVHKALRTIPPDWDLLLLGFWCVRCDRRGGWLQMKRFFGLHCYFIRQAAVAKILAYAGGRVSQQIDSMLSDMCSEGRLTVYSTEDKLATQLGTPSSVQMPLRAVPQVDPWLPLPAVLAGREPPR